MLGPECQAFQLARRSLTHSCSHCVRSEHGLSVARRQNFWRRLNGGVGQKVGWISQVLKPKAASFPHDPAFPANHLAVNHQFLTDPAGISHSSPSCQHQQSLLGSPKMPLLGYEKVLEAAPLCIAASLVEITPLTIPLRTRRSPWLCDRPTLSLLEVRNISHRSAMPK